MNLFEILNERYVLPPKPRLFESFAGIGCQRMAFERLGIEYESVGISEIDKYAIQSYMAIHGDTKNYGDITKIKGSDLPQIDVLTWSFPCQSLSKAGKQEGLQGGTRSGLVYEVLRIITEMSDKPKVLIMENVVDLVQTKFIREFNEIQLELESLGYSNYVETMNAKDYGVAQNRDRVFMVSILGDYYYEFPKPTKLEKRLKDYLESEVDEKYYLSGKLLNYFTQNSQKNKEKGNGFRFKPNEGDGVACSILTLAGCRMDDNFISEPSVKVVWNTNPSGNGMNGNVYQGDLSPTLTTNKGEGLKFVEPVICASRGRNPLNPKSRESGLKTVQMIEVNESGLCNTMTTVQKDNMVVEPSILQKGRGYNNGGEFNECPPITSNAWQENNKLVESSLRIRKLTPLECWRLMSIDDECFHRAEKVCSNSQLYKQAGNGLVVDVFAAIIKNLKGTHEI